MEYRYSDKIAAVQPSVIREILKRSADPSVIRFSAGNPAPDAFPVSEIQRIAGELLAQRPIDALQYGLTEGFPELIETLASYLKNGYQIGGAGDRLLITSGAQQVMDLTARCFLNEGDTVICESPSFIGSLNCFRSYGARLAGVPVAPDGMDVNALETALRTGENVKLIYTIPNFQNPSGVTMSMEKRQRVYALAKQYGVLIIEDNPYGDTRVRGADLPAIKTLDRDGLVIYSGSFSKILAPGLRVGFACVPAGMMGKLTVAKQCVDVHTPMLNQMIVNQWIRQCDVKGHIHKIKEIYRHKLNLMCDLIDSEMNGFFTYVRPEGGLFVWCALPNGVEMQRFAKEAVLRRVAVVPGNAFLTDENAPCQCIRLNFSTPTDAEICEGMSILSVLSKQFK